MSRSEILWGALWVVGAALLVGCSTSSPKHSLEQGNDGAVETRRPSGEAALEKKAQAHAHYAAGVVFEVEGKAEAALREYQQAALDDPENEPLVIEVSRRFLQNKEPEKALELLIRSAARPNASASIYGRLGFVYAQMGKTDQAIAASRTAIRKDPASLTGYQNLFLNYLHNKQPQEALKALDEAGKVQKASPEFLIGLAELYAHLGLQAPPMRKEANARALAVLNRAEKIPNLSTPAKLKLAEDYSLAGDSTKSAELFKELLNKISDQPGLRDQVRAKLAEIYLRESDAKHATEQLESILADDPTNPQATYSLGKLALEARQFDKAVDYLRKSILLNPDVLAPYYDLVRAQLALRNTSDALATLERARGKFPQDFALEYLSGVAFSQQKAYAEAIQHFTAAEVIAQATEPKWLDENFYFQLGAACERKADYEQAEKYFQQALKLAPEFSEALNYLGYMWAEHGQNLPKARELIEKAVKLEPKNPAFLDSLGWVLFKLDLPQQALEQVLKAVELSAEPDATLLDHLGDIYAALKQPAQARQAWEKSLAVEANDEVKKKLQEATNHP